jgi:hypothetical protein
MNRINKYVEENKKKLANDYLNLIGLSYMEERYVKSKVLQELWGCNDRQVRYVVEDVLHLYLAGYLPKLIIGTHFGYIYTNNPEIVEPYLHKKEQHWKSECVNCYYLQKRFNNKNNMTIKDYVEINI